jgi:hypothetical protein
MTVRLRYLLPFFAATLPLAALAQAAQAEPPKTDSGYTWPSHYDFFVPYGAGDGGPVYAKPGHKGVNLTLTCREATGILKTRGYEDIENIACTGSTYRFKAKGEKGRFTIEIDPRTGNIIKRVKL